MKKFWEISKKPLRIGIIASILYIIDALIGGLMFEGGSFMWVAFAFWTVFFGATITERLKALIGAVIGFASAVVMMLITSSFTLNVGTISISCLLGVFLINCAVMYLEKTEKCWTNSISGVFVGIFLTFSNLGVGLNPLTSIGDAALMLGIIVIYAILGLVCGFFSIFSFKTKNEIEPQKTNK